MVVERRAARVATPGRASVPRICERSAHVRADGPSTVEPATTEMAGHQPQSERSSLRTSALPAVGAVPIL